MRAFRFVGVSSAIGARRSAGNDDGAIDLGLLVSFGIMAAGNAHVRHHLARHISNVRDRVSCKHAMSPQFSGLPAQLPTSQNFQPGPAAARRKAALCSTAKAIDEWSRGIIRVDWTRSTGPS